MPRPNFTRFDFRKRVAYDDDAKRRFHLYARQQLRRLADALGLPSGTFDLRNNEGGIAVSGEITLHADHLYVQACQPATGHDTGFLVRTLRRAQGLYRRPQQLRLARSPERSRRAPKSKLVSTAGRAVSEPVDSKRKGLAHRSRVPKVVTQRHDYRSQETGRNR